MEGPDVVAGQAVFAAEVAQQLAGRGEVADAAAIEADPDGAVASDRGGLHEVAAEAVFGGEGAERDIGEAGQAAAAGADPEAALAVLMEDGDGLTGQSPRIFVAFKAPAGVTQQAAAEEADPEVALPV